MELGLVKTIQKLGSDFFDLFFCGFTVLGETFVFIALIPLFYWCFDKLIGEELIGSVFSGCYLNSVLKGLVARVRPIAAYGDELRRVKYDYFYESIQEDGAYVAESFPSGHSQTAALFFTTVAYTKGMKRRWWLLIFPVMVGISRLYLGVHWPTDVLVALVEGFVISTLIHFSMRKNKKATLLFLPGVASLFMLLCLIGADKGQIPRMLMLLALVWGGCLGMLFENAFIDFSTRDIKWWMRLLRIPVGLLAVLVCAAVVFVPCWVMNVSMKITLIPVCLVASFAMTTAAPTAFRMFRLD